MPHTTFACSVIAQRPRGRLRINRSSRGGGPIARRRSLKPCSQWSCAIGRVYARYMSPKNTMREWRLTALALVCACLALPQPAAAHLHRRPGDAQMRVMAVQVDYDYADHQFAAVGNVQIYYSGATIEANRVIYDQKTKRLRAEGNARLTEANGKVTYGEIIDLTDYYRDGFVDALGVETVAPRHAARQPQRRRSQLRQ